MNDNDCGTSGRRSFQTAIAGVTAAAAFKVMSAGDVEAVPAFGRPTKSSLGCAGSRDFLPTERR
jgi:hypothetical protein